MNRIKHLIICCFVCMSSAAFSQQPEGFSEMKNVQAFKASIIETIGKIETISATFSQEKHLSIFSKTIDSQGTMSFKAPSNLRWSYTVPYSYEIVIKNETISINDGGKVNTFDLSSSEKFGEINQLILNSITGKILDDERFTTSYYENATFQLVALKPKAQDISGFISEIQLFIDPKVKQVSKIKIVESASDYTVIKFSNQILNQPIADGIFNTP